jgi:hypothetical protein
VPLTVGRGGQGVEKPPSDPRSRARLSPEPSATVIPGGPAALAALLDSLLNAWIETADAQSSGGNVFGYADRISPHRLLHQPLAAEIPNLSAAHQRFVAGRSMRDVEPSVALSPRDPHGRQIANADDLG